MRKLLVIGLAVVTVFIGILLTLVFTILNDLPENNATLCLDGTFVASNEKIMINVGDSITHGTVSADYSKMLSKEMDAYGYGTINAGINSDLTFTVLRRIDEVIACKPTIVTILIGTNDIMASRSESKHNSYRLMGRIKKGDVANIETYTSNLANIVSALKEAKVEHIYLISPPLIGEDLSEEVNTATENFSHAVRHVAAKMNVNYIPLNEHMRLNIPYRDTPLGFGGGGDLTNNLLAARHYFLDDDLDDLFAYRGYKYLTDAVHLRTDGAILLNSLILDAFAADELVSEQD